MRLIGNRQRTQWRVLATLMSCALPLPSVAQSVWNGSPPNLWSSSGNWANNDVPGDSINEDAVINTGTAVLDDEFTLRHLTLGGGMVDGLVGGELDVQGLMTWSGGTIGAGAVINATGSLDLSGTLYNQGHLTAALTGGAINVNLLTILNNSGTISVSGSTLNLRSGTNSGRLEAGAGGTMLFQGVGSYTLAAGSSLAGTGTFSIASAVQLQESVSVANLTLSGSILGGTLTTGGRFDWTGGEMKGGGKTTIATGSLVLSGGGVKSLESRELVNNSTIDWGGNGDWLVHTGASVANNSQFRITGDATMSLAPLTSDGSLINTGSLVKSSGSGVSAILIPIQNSGTVQVTTGTLKVGAVGGAGTWTVSPGATLVFAAGSANPAALGSGVSMNNAGTLVNAGYLSAPATMLTSNNLIMDALNGAELNIIGDLSTAAFDWNRGVISGPGTTTNTGISFDSAWGVAGGRTLENSGTLAWTSGASWGLGAVDVISAFDNLTPGVVKNLSNATITFESDGVMGLPGLPGALNVENAGEIKVLDGQSVSVHGSIANDGTVRLGSSASMTFAAGGSSGGTFLVGEDATLAFTGTTVHSLSSSAQFHAIGGSGSDRVVLFDSTTANLAGTVGGSIALQAGSAGDSTLNVLSGAAIQAASMRVAAGSVEVYSGSTINVPRMEIDGGRMTLHGGSVNVGSTTLDATLKINTGATFQTGSFESSSSSLLWLDGGTLSSGGSITIGGSVVGAGTIGGSVQTQGAVLTPADLGTVGQFDITGGLTLDASAIVGIDVNATNLASDRIEVGSGLNLEGAMLLITIIGDPSGLNGSGSFVILSSSARSGTFSNASGDRIAAYDQSFQEVGNFQLSYTGGDVILSNWVPEPPMQSLLLGFGFLLRRRRAGVTV